jgi:hypothetical protein
MRSRRSSRRRVFAIPIAPILLQSAPLPCESAPAMNPERYAMPRVVFAVAALGLCLAAIARSPAPMSQPEGEPTMNQHASGPFEVKIAAQKADNPQAEAAGVGRMSLDKRFRGDLDATSSGEMLAFRTAIADSAGYVAIERVQGSLHGRSGSFALQHSSTMERGAQRQNIIVIPDSGTGELAGLSGSMTIVIAPGGAHSYEFDYSLPEPAP